MDLSTLNVAQLKDLQTQIPAELKRREKDEKAKLIKDLAALAAERGFNLGELLDAGATKVKAKGSVAAKYQSPSDSRLTWTGRGRQPKWVADAIANGSCLDTLLIK